jgi:hypothetical protein
MLPFELDHFGKRPSMWIANASYDTACAYLRGLDMACHGGLLHGFDEWFVITYEPEYRGIIGRNFAWEKNLKEVLDDQMSAAERTMDQNEKDALWIDRLIRIIAAFYEQRERRTGGGLRKIMVQYQDWLKAHEGYNPELDD